jgi:hypothetical protein
MQPRASAYCLQAELLDKIRELLEKRGQGEKLEVFNHEKFPRFRDVVQYFSSEVGHVTTPALHPALHLAQGLVASTCCFLLVCRRREGWGSADPRQHHALQLRHLLSQAV